MWTWRADKADGDGQWGLIREFLQFALEKPQTGSLATTAVGGDQAFRRIRIGFLTHIEPPLPNAFHGKGSGIVVRAHVDPSRAQHGIIHPNVVRLRIWKTFVSA